MKFINILSLTQAHNSLTKESFNSFLKHYGIEIKSAEIEDLKCMINTLFDLTEDINIFDGFYVGYKIPQIGKEFDLLRFGKEVIINVELKKTSTDDKIRKQLLRNRYYLSYLGKKIYSMTFVSDTKKLHILNEDETLVTIEANAFKKALISQGMYSRDNINKLFNPSDYLVSPFNSTNKFLNKEYFLTNQQEDIKLKIFNSFMVAKSETFISIIGGAGTGKTLLVYDIVRELRENGKRPLIVHCGYLNEGQEQLKVAGWEIITVKSCSNYSLSNYDVIIIDEVQRIYPSQLEKIIETITISKGTCIFSYDKLQTLAKWEEQRDIDSKISKIHNVVIYTLSERIRTNKEIAVFIKLLFNNKRSLDVSSEGNIEINYFNNIDDAKKYLSSLSNNGWEVIRFTPSLYNKEHHEQYSEDDKKTSHKVIGQEFDSVAITIDNYFSYDENGDLIYRGGSYYYPTKMLFQNITRARKRVNLIIIENEELLNRCLSILQ